MILIDRIVLREICLTLREPFQISSGTMTDRRILLVQLEDADGYVGWGECVAEAQPNYSPETIDVAWIMIRDHVAPRVLGVEFGHPGEIHGALEKDFRGHNMAKAAVEMAAWELAATIEKLPLSKLLGGTREKIGTGISIGIQPNPEALVAKAKRSVEEGYQKIKVKIKPGADLAYVREVFMALGDDAHIMVDANNAYSLDDTEHLKKLDQFNLLMLEQPLAWDDVYQHSKLQKELYSPICLDESITNVAKAREMIEQKAGRIINIKPGRVGGFTQSKGIHDLCQEHDIPVWCGGMLESGIGRAHNVALASLPNFTLPGDVSPSARYWEKDIVTPEWTMDDQGFVTVPLDSPGMGVTVDMAHVDRITSRQETVRRS